MQSPDVRMVTEAAQTVKINAATAPLKATDIAHDQRLDDLEVLGGLNPGNVNDTTTASLIRNVGSETHTELSAAIDEHAKKLAPIDTLDAFFAALDMREDRSLVIAQAGDSTGDAANEYFELAWKEMLGTNWVERPADVRRWSLTGNGGLGTYLGPFPLQDGTTGGYTEKVTVYEDSFPRDASTIINNPDLAPKIGNWYDYYSPHGSFFSVQGGKLIRGGTEENTRATFKGGWAGYSESNFRFTGTVKTPADIAGLSSETMVASDTELVARISIDITGTGVATFTKFFDGVKTTIATFPAGTYTGTDVPFEITADGTAVTATLAGNTVSGTLTQAEADTLASLTATVVRSQIIGTAWGDFKVTSSKTYPSEPSTLPTVSVFNGGAAGKTAQYQRDNLAAMYPWKPDILFINHGHNYNPAFGWNVTTFLESIQGLVDELTAMHGPLPVVVTSQNPQFGSGWESTHLAYMKALREYAIGKGWGYVPTFEAFAKRPDGGADQMLDALHPGIGTGRRLQADVAKGWIGRRSKRD